VRRQTFFRDAVYTVDERAGWLLHECTFIWGGENVECAAYWLVSDGTIALTGGGSDRPPLDGRRIDISDAFHHTNSQSELRAAYAALVELGRKYDR